MSEAALLGPTTILTGIAIDFPRSCSTTTLSQSLPPSPPALETLLCGVQNKKSITTVCTFRNVASYIWLILASQSPISNFEGHRQDVAFVRRHRAMDGWQRDSSAPTYPRPSIGNGLVLLPRGKRSYDPHEQRQVQAHRYQVRECICLYSIRSYIYAAITEPSIIPEAPDWESFASDEPETNFDHDDITCPPFTEPIHDTTGPLFTDCNGNPVYFSAGSGVSDPLAESLARALRAADIHNPSRPFAHDEVPLQDLDEDEDEDEEESLGQFSGMFILF